MRQEATILLVEDDLALLEGIADLLQIADLGYDVRVLTAVDGLAGLNMLQQELPDLVISDIMMPRMDGYALLERIRSRPEWVHIPVIFLTARGRKEDVLKGRLSGAELYITKPFENDELMEMVRGQLDRAFQLQGDRQMKYDLLARSIIHMLNHEFRTPLTYVTAYYEMLAKGLMTEDAAYLKEYLHGIQIGASRLRALVDDLLQVVALRTGEAKARLKASAERIDDLAGRAEAWCQRQYTALSGQPAVLEWQIPEKLPAIYGDWAALEDVLDRLLDNALKFSRPGLTGKARISVAAGVDNGRVFFSVTDNGVGFPARVRERVFDLFYQHDRESMEQQGAGTGLAIVKGQVELHRGKVRATSEVGRGSTFTVELPMVGHEAETGRAGVSGISSEETANILLVEDERHLLAGLKELLELFEGSYRINVMTASDGRQGMQVMSSHQPDLIISDILMPRMDGYEFLAAVRQRPEWVHIPFIFLTARGSREDIVRGRRSGAEEYVTKPYDGRELFDLVIAKLDRYFQRQEVINQSFEELKRGILSLLLPDFRLPIRDVSEQSSDLARRLEEAEDEAELTAYLKGIQAGSRKVSRFVEDFIFLVELQTGEVATAFESRAYPIDSHLFFKQMVNLWQDLLTEAGVSLEMDLAVGLPPVYIDGEIAAVALQRLLAVILRMVREKSCTSLAGRSFLHSEEVHLQIMIPDNCLTADRLEQCQDLLNGPVTAMIGTDNGAMGLMIARGVIETHGGRLTVMRDPEEGCAFDIALPVFQPALELVDS